MLHGLVVVQHKHFSGFWQPATHPLDSNIRVCRLLGLVNLEHLLPRVVVVPRLFRRKLIHDVSVQSATYPDGPSSVAQSAHLDGIFDIRDPVGVARNIRRRQNRGEGEALREDTSLHDLAHALPMLESVQLETGHPSSPHHAGAAGLHTFCGTVCSLHQHQTSWSPSAKRILTNSRGLGAVGVLET